MLISRRANTILLVLILAAGIGIVAMLASDARGGPLDPPGAPGSTDSVRLPGTPITSLPYTISQPGNYYLTRNLTGAPSTPGITIDASNVTLDLNGFNMAGGGPVFPANAITATAGVKTGLVVRNGSITGWGGGFYGTGTLGRAEFTDLRISDNVNYGLKIGTGSVVRRVVVQSNGDGVVVSPVSGVTGGTVIEDSVISGNTYTGVNISDDAVRLQRNVIESNGASGVYVLPGKSLNEVLDNRIAWNGMAGVWLDGYNPVYSWGNVVARNSLLNNGGGPVQNDGVNNRIGPYVSDTALTSTNPWSNIAY